MAAPPRPSPSNGDSNDMNDRTATQPTTHHTRFGEPTRSAERRRMTSEALLRGASCLEIEHNGEIYTLRRTRKEKLILTK